MSDPVPHRDPEPRRRTIVVAADERFARPAAVVLRSAFDHCRHDRVRALVVDCGLTPADREMLGAAWPLDLELRSLEPERFRSFKTDRARAALARLALEHHLPRQRGRVLYLDSDVLVRGPLDPLFEAELHGCTLGAVPALARITVGESSRGGWSDSEYAAGGAAPGAMIFNSGVLLIDLERWHDQRVFDRAAALASRFAVSDQRILNSLLSREWFPLDRKWNDKAPGAAIYHFASDPRPWQRGYYRNPVWLEYLRVAESLEWHIDRPAFLRTRVALRQAAAGIRNRLRG